MITRRTSQITGTALITIALGLFAATPFQLQAQTKGSAKGGATKLMQLTSGKTNTTASTQTHASMNCPECVDRSVVVRNVDPKGAGGRAINTGQPQLRKITRHQCGDCANEWKVAGHGKTKSTSSSHKCVRCT